MTIAFLHVHQCCSTGMPIYITTFRALVFNKLSVQVLDSLSSQGVCLYVRRYKAVAFYIYARFFLTSQSASMYVFNCANQYDSGLVRFISSYIEVLSQHAIGKIYHLTSNPSPDISKTIKGVSSWSHHMRQHSSS